MIARLSEADISEALLTLDGWVIEAEGGALRRSFQFKDFKDAFAFMTHMALYAEQKDHHPEWFNVYNRLDVRLTTHDAGGVSLRDIDMARVMNNLAARMKP